ncbi:MAG: HAD hydrolase-like protein [Actinomycetaceae bacterium]|nr:HAD hydrolase-like protein [Actinomycetaceae bacterium]
MCTNECASLAPHAVIFDMDGTLIDSTQVIITSIYDVFTAEMGYEGVAEDFKKCVGPPLEVSFAQISGASQEKVIELIGKYRSIYSKRAHAINPYPGIETLIRALFDAGVTLAVATAKLETAAIELLEEKELASYFQVVCGAQPYGKNAHSKIQIVERALTSLRHKNPSLTNNNIVMIGDRFYDVEGATQNGIRCIGANWAGLAEPDEFNDAYCVVQSVDELRQLLAPHNISANDANFCGE